ncbi:MAG: hypothetical protein H7282_14130 [Cytophagaceae bacterium]|nr:hypothetical protein [Cytophagaceae bacterium]
MKKIYNNFLNRRNTVLACTLLFVILFSGCKKNNDEVDSSLIESKLITGTGEHWVVAFKLSNDICGSNKSVILVLDSNHHFTYTNSTCSSFTGSWNADYANNRSGQFLNLNFTYLYNSKNYQESIALKYSSEQDIFYSFDKNDFTLTPFNRRITTAP